jgi:long-chain acyl-CoA synthetase
MLSHGNIVVATLQFRDWYEFVPADEVMISVIPMFHAGGMTGVMNVPLAAGATLLVFRRFVAARVAHAVTHYQATRLFGVPTVFLALLDDEKGRHADYSSLRACRTNATALPPSVKAAFDDLVGRSVLVEAYGLTEMTTLTHANPLTRARPGKIGFPLRDTEARIVDPATGTDVPAGGTGELLVRGPQMMRGYWNRPQESSAAFIGGWLKTGDIAVIDGEGYYAIVGRRKDMINTAGFKVWPREVEEVLVTHPGVKMAMVVGIPDQYRGEIVKAVVVRRGGSATYTTENILRYCRERLASYKVPRSLEFQTRLPMNDVGKILRRQARDA